MNNLDVKLKSGAQDMGIALTDEQLARLCAFVGLLVKWNKVYNLTAVRCPDAMISRHILDSLSILPYIRERIPKGGQLIDVGSGPGLPGLPLAIMLPDIAISTLDCVGKKTRFQVHACMELGLDNVTVLHERVENWNPGQNYDGVVSRAFSSLHDLITSTDHLLNPKGKWLAMKGVHPDLELDDLNVVRPDVVITASCSLEVADCDSQRHLVILERMDTALV